MHSQNHIKTGSKHFFQILSMEAVPSSIPVYIFTIPPRVKFYEKLIFE